MLVYVAFLALLFIDTVLANVCSNVYEKPAKILAVSIDLYQSYNFTHCKYFLKAPVNHYIALNFSQLSGFGFDSIPSTGEWSPPALSPTAHRPAPRRVDSSECMPRLDIVKVLKTGKEKAMATICPPKNVDAPLVFQSNMPNVIVTYSWDPGTKSIMALSFSFNKKSCESQCQDGSPDCLGEYGETNCSATELQPSVKSEYVAGNSHVLKLVVIVVAFVLILLIVCCVFGHYNRFSSREPRHHRHNSPSDSSDHNQFHAAPIAHRSHEVVYVPQTGMLHDRLHNSNQHHQQQTQKQWSTSSHDGDTDTSNLPPQIPISLDGEEGYQNSQRLLQPSSVSHEVVNPPPNKTVFQGESPPPYRAHSVGQLDKSRISGRSRAGRDCRSSPCVPYSHPTSSYSNSSTGAAIVGGNSCNGGSAGTYSTPHRNNIINNSSHHGMTTATNGHQCGDGNSHHYSLFPAGTPVLMGRNSYHPVAPTSTPRSVRIFSDPSSSTSALTVGHQLRTASGSTSSNSSAGPVGYLGPPPMYSDLSDAEVFDVLSRPSPPEAS